MAQEIIQVEGLSKMYRLGEINTGTLSHDLNRWWSRLRGKDDPYQKLAEVNDRTTKGSTGYVWSLKDINFSVKEGEVFGIIGKNGAGKSTLLKIMSKITKPSRGSIYLDGRIASLLEVGTGFHPDLSGRENVFLNGAILGMRKHEIKKRFDEIVDFSGIERYIDTPVKRYSSGMFVRLAFAVAAHLEPEILIIDEVLAVGDAEFQEKCLGKMKDVSQKQGRTVLFVSHNMAAIKQLCHSALLLEKGTVKMVDQVEKVMEVYQTAEKDIEKGVRHKLPDNTKGYFLDWNLEGQSVDNPHSCFTRESITVKCRFHAITEMQRSEFHIAIRNLDGVMIIHGGSMDYGGKPMNLVPGDYEFGFSLELPVKQGKYTLEMGLLSGGAWIDTWTSTTQLVVLDDFEGFHKDTFGGLLNVKTTFHMTATPTVVEQQARLL
jgi:lipopolysaccharide transport system ATP-binding protein